MSLHRVLEEKIVLCRFFVYSYDYFCVVFPLKVCRSSEEYVGFDRNLGTCVCMVSITCYSLEARLTMSFSCLQSPTLDSVCDISCRLGVQQRMQLVCQGETQIMITYDSGAQVSYQHASLCSALLVVP